MKWFFAFLSVVVGFGVGYFFSIRKKRRANLFSKLSGLCEKISNNLSFSRDEIETILNGTKENNANTSEFSKKDANKSRPKDNSDLKTLNTLYFSAREDEAKLETTLKTHCKKCALAESEMNTIVEFYKSLGKTDVKTQDEGIKHFKGLFDDYYKDAFETYKKQGGLYWKLGLLIGIGVGILIV